MFMSVVAGFACGGSLLAQHLTDIGDAFAALRLAAEPAIDHRHGTAVTTAALRLHVAIGQTIAQADIHARLGSRGCA